MVYESCARSATIERTGSENQGLSAFNRMDNRTAQDLLLLLTAAHHYAQKLDARLENTDAEERRASYSTHISDLLMHLHNEMCP